MADKKKQLLVTGALIAATAGAAQGVKPEDMGVLRDVFDDTAVTPDVAYASQEACVRKGLKDLDEIKVEYRKEGGGPEYRAGKPRAVRIDKGSDATTTTPTITYPFQKAVVQGRVPSEIQVSRGAPQFKTYYGEVPTTTAPQQILAVHNRVRDVVAKCEVQNHVLQSYKP